jgi:hypothetical protein
MSDRNLHPKGTNSAWAQKCRELTEEEYERRMSRWHNKQAKEDKQLVKEADKEYKAKEKREQAVEKQKRKDAGKEAQIETKKEKQRHKEAKKDFCTVS